MEEIDITSGDTTNVAAIDSALWAARGGDITSYARGKGFSVDHWPEPPAAGTAEQNLFTMADATVWIDTMAQQTGARMRGGACPPNPPPIHGYAVWQGKVPDAIAAWAVSLLKTVKDHPFGYTWTENYDGAAIIARIDVHTWHYQPDGTLLTGLCWKGITIYRPIPIQLRESTTVITDPATATPDPSLAVFDNAPTSTNWGLVALTGLAIGAVATAFILAIRAARVAAAANPLPSGKRTQPALSRCELYDPIGIVHYRSLNVRHVIARGVALLQRNEAAGHVALYIRCPSGRKWQLAKVLPLRRAGDVPDVRVVELDPLAYMQKAIGPARIYPG